MAVELAGACAERTAAAHTIRIRTRIIRQILPAIAPIQAVSGRYARCDQRLEAAGKPPARLEESPENLEDDDLLEMVNAGLIKAVVVGDYLATFWAQMLPKLDLNPHARLRTGGDLAIAIRKNSPQVKNAIDGFQKKFGVGTVFGNTIRKRYMQNTGFANSATSREDRQTFESLIALFRKYGTQYSVDYLLMAAQGYQESRLDPASRARSELSA